MTIEEVIQRLNSELEQQQNKALTSIEMEILQAVWAELAYSDVAKKLYISEGYIKNVASRLWQRLSDLFGQTVNKANVRSLIAQYIPSAQRPPSTKGTIMIIDDLIANLDLLSQMLTEQSYRVRTMNNGRMALRSIHSSLPDLILLDIKMPEMDGFAVCEALKADPESAIAAIPVIFLSAIDEVFDKVRAFELGAVDYITKPFQAIEVLKRIETQLKLQQQQRQLQAEIEAARQQEALLHQSYMLLVNVLNTSRDGIVVAQAVRDLVTGTITNFRFVLANPRWMQILGSRHQELLRDRLMQDSLEQLSAGLFALCQRVIERGELYEQLLVYNGQTYELSVIQLGDGIVLTLHQPQPSV